MNTEPNITHKPLRSRAWPDLSVVLGTLLTLDGRLLIGRRVLERRVVERTKELQGILAEREEALREAKVWADVLRHAPVGIGFHKPGDETLVLVNPAYADACGIAAEDLKGMRLAETFTEVERPRLADILAKADSGGRATFQTRHLHKNGSSFPVEVDVASIHDAGGTVIYRVVSSRDITERCAMEQAQERERLELERSNADLESFAYAASHDLKAPLRAIMHLADWIHADIESSASVETCENLLLLQGRTRRLQVLLDGLLSYSRIGGGQCEVENVDIAEMVRDITRHLSPPPGFVITSEGPMLVLRTQMTPIRVTLENLIGNSIKHHDRAEGFITVSLRSAGDTVEFRVSDDGPGIAPQFHEKIFTIFQTLASRDDVEGSGIGLSIVRKHVESHGGRTRIESVPPKRGTTFIFTWKEDLS